MRNLNKTLQDTIAEKDTKYIETVMTLETQNKIAYESMEAQLIEEREIAVNDVETQRDKDNYQNQVKYQKLEE